MKILHQNIPIKASKKTSTFVSNKDLFKSYFDSDFENYGTDRSDENRPKSEVAVLEMDKDGTFEQIFKSVNPDIEKCVMTQGQIISFIKDHEDKLRQEGLATFFLFKVGDEFFVARVVVDSGGLGAGAPRFSDGRVWRAESRLRVVVPQLALSPLESSPSEYLTLEKAIEMVKEAGYEVYKKM